MAAPNGSIRITGTLDTTDYGGLDGFVGALRTHQPTDATTASTDFRQGTVFAFNVSGAGLAAPGQSMWFPACVSVAGCSGTHGESASFFRKGAGNLVSVKLRAQGKTFPPPLRSVRRRSPCLRRRGTPGKALDARAGFCIYNEYTARGGDPMAQNATRDVSINIRARNAQRDLIDRAAEAIGKNRSDFMLEAACERARNVMLDQTFFGLDAKTFERFRALVDRPLAPRNRASLKRLLARKPPWKS